MRMLALGLFCVGLWAVGSTYADEPPRRPDIVLFLADDLSWADCSMFGGKDVPTPNMERLARAGMTFSHAFVASPSCAPSRAALLTGLDPMRNGAMLNHARPKMAVKTWPAYFHDLGYEVAAIGKTAHYAQVTTYGFDHASHYTYHDDQCVSAAVGWLGTADRDQAALPDRRHELAARPLAGQTSAPAGRRRAAADPGGYPSYPPGAGQVRPRGRQRRPATSAWSTTRRGSRSRETPCSCSPATTGRSSPSASGTATTPG